MKFASGLAVIVSVIRRWMTSTVAVFSTTRMYFTVSDSGRNACSASKAPSMRSSQGTQPSARDADDDDLLAGPVALQQRLDRLLQLLSP